MRSKSDYIPDSLSETKPCVLSPVDLQLDSGKEFEDQVAVIVLLTVDNAFCVVAQLQSVVLLWEFLCQTVSG